MALNHFTPEFAKTATDLVKGYKKSGASAMEAARALEIACGRANEEYSVDGKPLVEKIYDGQIDLTTATFEPNPK